MVHNVWISCPTTLLSTAWFTVVNISKILWDKIHLKLNQRTKSIWLLKCFVLDSDLGLFVIFRWLFWWHFVSHYVTQTSSNLHLDVVSMWQEMVGRHGGDSCVCFTLSKTILRYVYNGLRNANGARSSFTFSWFTFLIHLRKMQTWKICLNNVFIIRGLIICESFREEITLLGNIFQPKVKVIMLDDVKLVRKFFLL